MAIKTVKFYAHSSDCSQVTFIAHDGYEVVDHIGYFPHIDKVCGGDDLRIEVDNETGRIIGWVPFTEETARTVVEDA